MAGAEFAPFGVLLAADINGDGTAIVEAAGRRGVEWGGNIAGENDPVALAFSSRVWDGNGGEKGLSVRVEGFAVESVAGSEFDDLTEIHDGDAMAHGADDGEVVGDEEIGEAEAILKLLEEVDDLGLDRDIKGREGLIGDDEPGLDGEGAGDADTLPLTAGELVREAVGESGADADGVEQLRDALPTLVFMEAVDGEGFGNDPPDAHAGIKRGVGVLEDHLDAAADLAEAAAAKRGEVDGAFGKDWNAGFVAGGAGVEPDVASCGPVQLEDGAASGRFATARLTDEAKGLAVMDGEGEAIDGLDGGDLSLNEDAALDGEVELEVLHLDQGPAGKR